MAIESSTDSPEVPLGKDAAQSDRAGSHLLASAYEEHSFTQGADDRVVSSDNGIQVASAALSAGIWTGLQNDAQRDGGGMTDASPEQPELILAGSTGELSAGKLREAAHAAVNRTDLGNVVPRDARNFAGYRVPEADQCASSLSEMLETAGFLSSRDYQIRVKDMVNLLSNRLGPPDRLSGNFDRDDFPDGAVGIISGTGHFRNGTNHIAVVERNGNDISIIHNKNGKIVRENIADKFYYRDGSPRYSDMRLFKLR
ncbi:hypothetical protein GC174_05885 [bacterium]|nr:hypothetical protein [bacterium]